jgi:topoisomerase IV subunit B
VHEAPFTLSRDEGLRVDLVLQWTEATDEHLRSYVNGIPTGTGGTHESGLRAGIGKAVRNFIETHNLSPKGVSIAAEDIREGLTGVLSLFVEEPQFQGQTKDRLNNPELVSAVDGLVRPSLEHWLNHNISVAEAIVARIILAARAREASRAAQAEVTRKSATSSRLNLPGKLSDCTNPTSDGSELFIVEGDSAGGSAKQARDREFQAVLPLRGKILNTWEVEAAEVLQSQEVHHIAIALGVDPGSDKLDGLRYHKVCILADADSDGLHIATLLCALFLRHFRPLVLAGHVHVAMPPLYRIDVGKQVYYALDDAERAGILDRVAAENPRAKPQVTRFKGLGEMSAMQLRETTMAPETRRLVQLTVEAKDQADQTMDMMLAKKRAADRREWLETKGNLAEVQV